MVEDGRVAGVAFQGLGGDTDNIGYIIPSLIVQNFLDALSFGASVPTLAGNTHYFGSCCSAALFKKMFGCPIRWGCVLWHRGHTL